jgi:hypothetical protein
MEFILSFSFGMNKLLFVSGCQEDVGYLVSVLFFQVMNAVKCFKNSIFLSFLFFL